MITAAKLFFVRYIKFFKWGAVALAIAATAFFVYDYGKQKQTVTGLEATNSGLSGQIDEIREDLESQKKRLQDVRKGYTRIRNDYNALDEQIQAFSTLSDKEVLDNRESVEEQIGSQLEEVRERMECESGDKSKC